jgi:molybdopterin synthase sulfur carrier subunit
MTGSASITVFVPGPLRKECAGAQEIALRVATVRDSLEELGRLHPGLRRSICDETGAVRRHINLFVNTEHIRELEGLDTRFAPGNVLTIMTAVSGG